MPITLTINNTIQDSVQKGDVIYYATPSNNAVVQGSIIRLGLADSIDHGNNQIVVDPLYVNSTPSANDFILFSKDNRANMMTLVGYYAEVKFINNSTTEAELFAVSSDIFESSK